MDTSQTRTVIVVNDDPMQLRLLSAILEGDGLRVVPCHSAEQALQRLRERASVDLIVTDLYMPGIDGWRFCRLLRSPEYADLNAIPVLVASATFSGMEVEEVTANLGANGFLSLPCNPAMLRAQARALLEGRTAPSTVGALIVEDNLAMAEVLREVFEAHGYTARVALTGEEARQLFRAHAPGVVILDYYLPDMTGDQLLEEFKQPASPAVVIVITGRPSPERAAELMQKGADGYVHKPFDPLYVIGLCEKARRERALVRVVEVLEERTQRLRESQERLRKSEERYRAFVQQSTEGIWCFDTDDPLAINLPEEEQIAHFFEHGYLAECNDVMARMYGFARAEDIAGARLSDLLVRSDLKNIEFLRAFVRSGYRLTDAETHEADAQGRPRYFMNNLVGIIEHGYLLRVWGMQRDITERKRAEEEMLKTQKLESIGLLAGGIAHDFNNLLLGILGNLSIARMNPQLDGETAEQLAAAEQAAMQARDLTHQLLTFATGGAPIKSAASIGDLIRDTAEFALRGSNVRCELAVPAVLLPVDVDRGQISQVIHNLMINAAQAMPGGGVIRVVMDNVTLGTGHGLPLKAGHYVKITVEDQGHGIPAEFLPKIFDPYFTTKQKGSGLGLTIAYSVVKRHDGHIAVESTLGVGTRFTLYLPASGEAAPKKEVRMQQPLRGRGKVLVMDDEELIRDVAIKMLRYIGYEAELASDGDEAIALYVKARESGAPFDAVIMDLTVPVGLGGREAIQKLYELDPNVKGLVSSGYSSDPVTTEFSQYGFRGFVAKPYRIQELADALDQIIKGP